MGYELAKAWVTVGADMDGFKEEAESGLMAAINSLTDAVAEMSKKLGLSMGEGMRDGLEEAKGGLLDTMKEMGSAAQLALNAMGIKFGVGEMFNIAGDSIHEAQTAIAAEKKLGDIIALQGEKAKGTAEEYQKLGDTIASNTQFDGAEIKNAMASLVPYGYKLEELNKILTQGSDIAALYGGDINKMGQDIAGALYAPLRKGGGLGGLVRKGFITTPEQEKAKKAAMESGDEDAARAVIWDILSGQGGMAKKLAESPAVKMQKEIADLKEALGRQLLPIQQSIGAVQHQLTKAMIGFLSVLAPVIQGVVGLATAFNGLGIKALIVISILGSIVAKWGMISAAFSASWALLLNPWTWLVVAIGLAVAGLTMFIQWLASLKSVQDAWTAAVYSLGVAWGNLVSAMSTAAMSVLAALDSAFGGFFSELYAWFAEGNATAGEFFAGLLTSVTNWVVGALEWFTVILEGWKIIWDNFGAIAMVGLSMLMDIWGNVNEFLIQGFAYAMRKMWDWTWWLLGKMVEGFVWLVGEIITLVTRIPEFIARMASGEGVGKIMGDVINTVFRNVNAGLKGLQGEAPDPTKLLNLSAQTKNMMADLAMGPLKPLMDRKKELEKQRIKPEEVKGHFNLDKPGVAEAAPAALPPWLAPDLGQGRFGFADFGKKIQDQLLGKDKDKHDKKMEGLAEKGINIQEGQLKHLETIAAKPTDGGLE